MRVLLVFLIGLALRAAAQSTCTDLQRLADSGSGIVCTRNSECSGLQCNVTHPNILPLVRRATLALLPCNQPAAARLVLYNSNTVILNQTQNRTEGHLFGNLLLSVQLVVTVEHPTGSQIRLGISASIRGLPTAVQLLSNTDITLNTSACSQATTIPTLVTTAPTHPVSATTSGTQTNTGSQSTSAPTSDPTSPTCQALETLQSSAQSLICNRNDQCDTVHCRVTDATVQVFISAANLTLLPCNQPPAVRLSINNPSGGVLVDRIISQSENISLPQEITLIVTLDQLINAIGFEATASTISFGVITSNTLVPYIQIPLDTSGCPKPTTTAPTLTTTVETSQQNMCEVLQQIVSRAQENFDCSTNQRCDGVDCTVDLLDGMPFQSRAVILVCQLPHPAVEIILLHSNGATILNETVDHSKVLSVGQFLQVNITFDQFQNAIGLQVEAALLSSSPVPVIEYTVIPIDTSNCDRPTLSTDQTATDETTDDGKADSSGNPLVAGATVLFLSLLGSRLCTL